MPTTYKILGQERPTGITNVDLYQVPSTTQAVVSTLSITNVTASDATATVYVRRATAGTPAAATDANALAKNVTISGGTFTSVTIGITLSAADVITVQSGTANALTFMAFGSELT